MRFIPQLILFLFSSVMAVVGQAATSHPGSAFMAELGCVNCHREVPVQSHFRELTPDLSAAGLRYKPAYLFDYLQNPKRVRQHLGRARMPNFRFSEKETLALVAFLQTQRTIAGTWPALPAGLDTGQPASKNAKEQLAVCLGCHTHEGKGANRAIDLSNVSPRLQPVWVKQFLVSPQMFGVHPTNMPPLFYRVDQASRRFEPNSPDAAEKVLSLTGYLFSLSPQNTGALDKRYAAAQAKYPDVTAQLGESIFRSQNCAACHRHHSILPRDNAAPDLTKESGRVNQDWLRNFLLHPGAIRPFGFHPGDGSRMPDFHLAADEVRQIANYLWTFPAKPLAIPNHQRLSAFSMQKAKALLNDKLSCLGCHGLGAQGGKMGPDLALVRARLQPGYVHAMIRDPASLNPHTIMPRLPLPEATVSLIANFLLQQDAPAGGASYLSLTDNLPSEIPTNLPVSKLSAHEQYLARCASCHGADGRGAGWNAKFLPKAPTAHADAPYMSTRPDDTLYDGIAAGGAILNKHHFMPAWAETLTPSEIKALVSYMRSLCRCEGPGWSRDNSAAKPR